MQPGKRWGPEGLSAAEEAPVAKRAKPDDGDGALQGLPEGLAALQGYGSGSEDDSGRREPVADGDLMASVGVEKEDTRAPQNAGGYRGEDLRHPSNVVSWPLRASFEDCSTWSRSIAGSRVEAALLWNSWSWFHAEYSVAI
jgi:hypothetical protein